MQSHCQKRLFVSKLYEQTTVRNFLFSNTPGLMCFSEMNKLKFVYLNHFFLLLMKNINVPMISMQPTGLLSDISHILEQMIYIILIVQASPVEGGETVDTLN